MKDFEGWQEVLSDREEVKFIIYPKLNHLFMPGEGESTSEEYMKENHIPGEVINDIAKWLLEEQ